MKRLSYITHFKIEFLLPFTGCREVLGKMPGLVFQYVELNIYRFTISYMLHYFFWECFRELLRSVILLVLGFREINHEIFWKNFLQRMTIRSFLFCFSANNHLLKVNNRNSRKRYEICSELKTKSCSGVFIVDFEHSLHVFVMFLLLT